MRFAAVATLLALALPISGYAQGTTSNTDQVSLDFVQSANIHILHSNTANAGGGVLGKRSNGNVLGVDSVVNWSSYFYEPAADGSQYTWSYTMVGNSPLSSGDDNNSRGQSTHINAPVIPVNLDLRNYDGSPRFLNGVRLYLDATHLAAPVLSSPVFSNTSYDSSEVPTQFTDAVQKAEFAHKAGDEWHTLLSPHVATARTLVLIRGTYQFATYSDGTLAYVLIDEGTFGSLFFHPPPPTPPPPSAQPNTPATFTLATSPPSSSITSSSPAAAVAASSASIPTTSNPETPATAGRSAATSSTTRVGSLPASLPTPTSPTSPLSATR